MLTFFRVHPTTKKYGVLLLYDNTRLHTTVCTTQTIIHFEQTVSVFASTYIILQL